MNKILLIIGTFLMSNNFCATIENAKKNAPHSLEIKYIHENKLNTLKWKHRNQVDIKKGYTLNNDNSVTDPTDLFIVKTTFVLNDIEYAIKCDQRNNIGILYYNDQEISRGTFTIQEDPNTVVIPILNIEGAQATRVEIWLRDNPNTVKVVFGVIGFVGTATITVMNADKCFVM